MPDNRPFCVLNLLDRNHGKWLKDCQVELAPYKYYVLLLFKTHPQSVFNGRYVPSYTCLSELFIFISKKEQNYLKTIIRSILIN